MAALTAIALAASLGSMAFGAAEDVSGKSQQEAGLKQEQAGYQTEQQAAAQQAAIYKQQAASSVQYAGQQRDINIATAAYNANVSQQSFGIAQNIAQQEQHVQDLNKTAMEVGARRDMTEQIRNQQLSRSQALAVGVSQGGSGFVGGSSARGGAYGQISGQSGTNLNTLNTSLQTGEGIYAANSAISGYNLQQSSLENQYYQYQAGVQTQNANLAYGYAQTNAGYQTQLADTQTLMSQGQGQVAMGQGQAQAGALTSATGNAFLSAGPNIFSAGVNMNQLTAGFTLPSFNMLFGNGVTGNGVFGIGGG